MPTRLIVGCMTGTSIDALDAALVEIAGTGLSMSARILRTASRPLGDLAGRLRAFASQTPASAGHIARLSLDFSLCHANVIRALLAGEGHGARRDVPPALNGRTSADLIAIHGQTVFHDPPASWQLLTPAPIAHALGTPVVFDLRAADLAAGGQGAPITPVADFILFRHKSERRAIVNLGGFANFTVLPCDGDTSAIRGGDICACNHLLDRIARSRLDRPYDDGGAIARSGRPVAGPLARLMEILAAQSAAGRSLGTGDELAAWVADQNDVPPADVARTACDAVGRTIACRIALHAPIDRLILAGGGIQNACLYTAIATAARAESIARAGISVTGDFGVPSAFREAAEMAILGALCQDRVPITLPAITGCPNPAPISGAWVLP